MSRNILKNILDRTDKDKKEKEDSRVFMCGQCEEADKNQLG